MDILSHILVRYILITTAIFLGGFAISKFVKKVRIQEAIFIACLIAFIFWMVLRTYKQNFEPYLYPTVPECFRKMLYKAVEYEAVHDKWPEDIYKEFPELQKATKHRYWDFTTQTYRDSLGKQMFIMQATLKVDFGDIEKGNYITCNNHEKKCYTHPLFPKRYFGAYLRYATYIGSDSLLKAYPIHNNNTY